MEIKRKFRRMALRFRLPILYRYVLFQFLSIFLLCLAGATVLFVVFDLFERMGIFIKQGTSFMQAFAYVVFKIPLVVQLMTPIAALIAAMIAVGRLSQLSEITAMRSCGASVRWLAKPLLIAGTVLSALVFIAGETLVPWATERGEEIYHVDIKKKVESGSYSRSNFWYRSGNRFLNIGFYDSRFSTIDGLSIFEFDENFRLIRRIDARQVVWEQPRIGWSMRDVVEVSYGRHNDLDISTYARLPLVIPEKPKDFYNAKRRPETMSYRDLRDYISKLRKEGVPTTSYEVDLASKISFPFVNLIVVLIAFPFSLTPARSGTMTSSFIAGVAIGFSYHVVHAFSASLGNAELLPVLLAAWAANILFAFLGGYLMAGADYA